MGKAWGGRLPGGTDRRVEEFTESVSFDRELYRHDVAGSIAHATMLAEAGLISDDEAADIARTLREIEGEIEAGRFPWDVAKEDIHLHIESALIERLGDVGRKLHTGRSRNDQVATDLKLWIRDRLDALDGKLRDLQRAFVDAAEREKEVVLPGYTHLQRAQPVLAAHVFLAYVEKFARDRGRLADCRARLNELPLGAAALAGTTLPIDRRRTMELLGFDRVAANSLDVSSDRDFLIETVFVLTLVAEHLSGWAEEWVLWSTTEFGFVVLPDDFCTGSSIMPHKKNPDVLELVRGKTARVVGSLTTLLVLVKGLPLAYNRDLQEDKPPLLDAMATVFGCLDVATPLIAGARLDRQRIAAGLEKGFLDATTLMERLIAAGVPMRSAHEAVGSLVRQAIEADGTLADLPDAAFEAAAPGIDADARKGLKGSLGVAQALQSFRSEGSTAPAAVEKRLALWQGRLA